MTARFADRVAFVTGGGGGIGAAICRRLADEGALVLVVDVAQPAAEGVAAEIRRTGARAEAVPLDITSRSAIVTAVADILDRHGRIDVLVNNAGINRRGALLDLEDADWDATLAVNLTAVFDVTRAVLPHMIAVGGGAIVNTASQWGMSPAPGHIAYNASKAAVVSFTKSLAVDYAPRNVRVNAVAPGEVRTPMVEANLARQGRSVAELDAKVPFGRIGTPEEVAALVAFLASDEAPYLCGSVVEITGAQEVA
jgi:2-hydroxycyclohexanecarboxyl-CoA dehydrogenase